MPAARWVGGGRTEGRLVASPAASLLPSVEWKGLRPGRFMARLRPCPFEAWDGGRVRGVEWFVRMGICGGQ